jgi:broad specificity phosphatase PhoE
MAFRIVLVRHGPSSHSHSGSLSRAEFLRWREAYEAAGILPNDVAPKELISLAAASGIVATSPTRRAIESAIAVAPQREIVQSALLQELDLAPPHIGNVRLPLPAWALMYGARWLARAALRRPQLSVAERDRIAAAAEWLEGLSRIQGTVVAITHASFRSQLARHLVRRGWRNRRSGWRSSHWSAWSLTR